MKIIVCGAGRVGTSIVERLITENNDITVIDNSQELIDHISDRLDVKAVLGSASYPKVLEEVNAQEADMIIAVTKYDEVNMIICQVAHTLFNVPTKIARIRHQNYLDVECQHLYRHDHLPIDYIISPEIEVAQDIIHRLKIPGALENIPLANSALQFIGFKCKSNYPIINIPISRAKERLLSFQISIIGIIRNNSFLEAKNDLEILPNDELYFISNSNHSKEIIDILSNEEAKQKQIIIVGGGNIGLYIAKNIMNSSNLKVKLIEADKERSKYIVSSLEKATVINGNALSSEILEEANVFLTDTIISVSNDDKVNILSSILAKQYGCKRSVTLINNSSLYSSITSSIGIDVYVSPKDITVSSILRYVRKGKIISIHSVCRSNYELIEAEAVENLPIVGKAISTLDLPKGIKIVTIIRNEKIVIPDKSFIINNKDRIIIFAKCNLISKVEKIFSVGFNFL